MLWNELYTTLTAAVDGSKVTDGVASTFATPSNFDRLLGYLQIQPTSGPYLSYEVYHAEEAH